MKLVCKFHLGGVALIFLHGMTYLFSRDKICLSIKCVTGK